MTVSVKVTLRSRLLRLGVLGMAVASLAAIAAPARAAEKGIASDMSWGLPAGVSESDQDRSAAAIASLGAQWVRVDVDWHWLDADPAEAWATLDRSVQLALDQGGRVLLSVANSPEWASGSSTPQMPPNDPTTYGSFMRTLVQRYHGRVDAYEVWNEPNIPRFWPSGPDASEYVALLREASAAVRATDPGATVVFGGLSTNDYNYVEAAYAAEPELGRYFDVMAVHPYPDWAGAPEPVATGPDGRVTPQSFTGYREVHDTMVRHGDLKPIWITEFGWSTCASTYCVTWDEQADYLTRAFEILEQDAYVQVAFWYTLRNNDYAFDADTWDDRLGLLRTDFTPKPAFQAYAAYAPEGGSAPPRSPTETSVHPTTTGPQQPPTPEAPPGSRPAITGRVLIRHGRLTLLLVNGRISGANAPVIVRLQRRLHGRWFTAIHRRVRSEANGRFSLRLRLRSGTKWRLRAVEARDGVISRSNRFLIRT
jgi:polysaccharide biosynthesis protein PslG